MAANGVARPQPSLAVRRPTHWLDAVTSQLALAPISMDQVQGLRKRSAFLDEPSIPGPYPDGDFVRPSRYSPWRRPACRSTHQAYRQELVNLPSSFAGSTRRYPYSVPFLICVLLGLAVKNHSLHGPDGDRCRIT